MTTDEQRLEAGWYPDPDAPTGERWWDGSQWTSLGRSGPGSDEMARLAAEPQTDRSSADQPVATAGDYSFAGLSARSHAPVTHAGSTVVTVQPTKSVGIALLLTFLFGPFGMFYSTVSGAILMLGIFVVGGIVVGVLTFGLAWIVWGPLVWVASMVWGCMAAADQSKAAVISTSAHGRGFPGH